MAEKGKSLSASARSKADKPRPPARAQPRPPKKARPKTPLRTPAEAEESLPREPLDVGPILDELLERVLAEHALAVVARQRVPFTVWRARNAILFVAEWRFLARDDGDPDRAGDPDPERAGIWSEDEEPQSCVWDSWTSGVVPVVDASLFSEEVPSEDLSVTGEAESLLGCPGEVPDAAVPVLDIPLPPGEVPSPPCEPPSAAAAAPPAHVLVDTVVPVPEPSRPELPICPRATGRGCRLSRAPGRGGILDRPPERGGILDRPPRSGRRPSRPPRPRPAPLDAPQAPLPTVPLEPPAQGPQESREGAAKVGDHRAPPPPSSRPSLASLQPRRPSRGAAVPRLGPRRGAARWVLPEVKVVDVTTEPERARPAASRSRLAPPGTPPGVGRAAKDEQQLCDPWLASARLAPGVTVRWGGSVRRGPAPAGPGGHGSGEREDEAVRSAEELKPILPYPECRISEYSE